MAVELPGLDLPMMASPNASTGIGQYCFVKLDTAGGSAMGDVIPAVANTDAAIGVNQDVGDTTTTLGGSPVNVAAGQSCRVRFMGLTKVSIASAVAKGDLLVVTAAGQVQTAPALTGTTPTSVHIVGQALQAGTNAGDLVTAILFPMASSIVQA